MKAIIIKAQRGNHSEEHILNYGKVILEGTLTEIKKELASMRKQCRQQWRETSTDDSMADFVAYEMGDIWSFKIKDGQWERL